MCTWFLGGCYTNGYSWKTSWTPRASYWPVTLISYISSGNGISLCIPQLPRYTSRIRMCIFVIKDTVQHWPYLAYLYRILDTPRYGLFSLITLHSLYNSIYSLVLTQITLPCLLGLRPPVEAVAGWQHVACANISISTLIIRRRLKLATGSYFYG